MFANILSNISLLERKILNNLLFQFLFELLGWLILKVSIYSTVVVSLNQSFELIILQGTADSTLLI